MNLPRALILTGVAAWIPYGVWKYLLGGNPPLAPFLTVHLCGVIPGAILKLLARRKKNQTARAPRLG